MKEVRIDLDGFFLRTLNVSEDLANYLYWMSNPKNNEFIVSSRADYTLTELKQFIKECNSSNEVLLLGIFDVTNNKHVGNIKYDILNLKSQSATMGILLGERNYRGIGLAKQVIYASSSWLHRNLGIKEIYLGVDRENEIAIKLYSSLGFKRIENEPHGSYSMKLNIK